MALRRSIAITALAGCFVAAGCSTSGTGTVASPPSKTELQSVVLTHGDLPSGWTGKHSTDTGSDPDVQAQLLDCIGAKGIDLGTKLDQVYSDDFSTDQGLASASSSASSFKSQKLIDARVKLLTNSKAEACLNQTLQTALAKSGSGAAKFGTPTISLHTGPSGGPRNVAAVANGTVDVTAQGQQAKVYLDLYFIRGPLVTATMEFTGVTKQVDPALQKKLVAAVAMRAAKG
ncbi:MAG: hypothetical protein ACR2LX_10470 [Jatrophihabitans sp.]